MTLHKNRVLAGIICLSCIQFPAGSSFMLIPRTSNLTLRSRTELVLQYRTYAEQPAFGSEYVSLLATMEYFCIGSEQPHRELHCLTLVSNKLGPSIPRPKPNLSHRIGYIHRNSTFELPTSCLCIPAEPCEND